MKGAKPLNDSAIREDLPGERWLPIVGYEGLYEISDRGRVWSVPRTVVGVYGVTQRVPGGFRKVAPNGRPDT